MTKTAWYHLQRPGQLFLHTCYSPFDKNKLCITCNVPVSCFFTLVLPLMTKTSLVSSATSWSVVSSELLFHPLRTRTSFASYVTSWWAVPLKFVSLHPFGKGKLCLRHMEHPSQLFPLIFSPTTCNKDKPVSYCLRCFFVGIVYQGENYLPMSETCLGCHPDITYAIDWALKANYLSLCLGCCIILPL